MKNSFSHEKYRTALGEYKCFKPLFESLTEEDYDGLAKKYSELYSYHWVVADFPCSEAWANALRKYATPNGTLAIVAAIFSDTGLNVKKMRIRLQADMDRGKIFKSKTAAIIIFNCHSPVAPGEHYIWDLNRNFYGF